ncbi:tetratricopeptide repeat protein [candidate division CSSED10-310 bacterium]|uniref:Tetratricopeptide repeat protein n=1 Tax=candidate division CSSED10-310 bacterium TaxID=2855610 RepID=A0ABV6Z282_UNCC1
MTALPPEIGPYRILKILGLGGMGVVYRGIHEETRKIVAIKTVRPGYENTVHGIRKEIRTLAKIKHPGIVKILSEGIHNGLPWYAMEWLNGKTLRHYFADLRGERMNVRAQKSKQDLDTDRLDVVDKSSSWWTESFAIDELRSLAHSRLDVSEVSKNHKTATERVVGGGILADILTVVKLICDPVAFLHGEGIVHRDLKPDNIIINESGFPILVDFGLMTQSSSTISREMLNVENLTMGTAHYMSPEQIQGHYVDARADLYALGCMLYELITGQKPFSGSIQQVLYKHLEEQPIPPAQLVTGVPDELNKLILDLMEKDPWKRIGYADDVARVLARLGAGGDETSYGERPRSHLYRPRFTGREEQMSMLTQKLLDLDQGQGGIVFIGGESGVGKTRLAMELVRISQWRDLFIFTGECADSSPKLMGPFQHFFQYLSDQRNVLDDLEIYQLVTKNSNLLARYIAVFREKTAPLDDHHQEPYPPEDRERFFDLLLNLLITTSRKKPILLIFDDLQWGDDLTLDFLQLLLERRIPQTHALTVVGLYRSEEITTGLKEILTSEALLRMNLSRLAENAVDQIIKDMLALASFPRELSKFLARYSRGNPFFVTEFIKTAVGEDLISRDDEGQWQVGKHTDGQATYQDFEALRLPRSIMALIKRRIKQLPTHALHIAEAAAVIGRESATFLLQDVSQLPDEIFLDALAELSRQQFLEQSEPGSFRFIHDKIREVIYNNIRKKRKTRLHHQAALSIEEFFKDTWEDVQAVLGKHWERADDPEKALENYLAAARLAVNQHAYGEAEKLYRSYLQLTVMHSRESIRVMNELGRYVLQIQARIREARHEHELALRRAQAIKDKSGIAESLLNLGWIDYAIAGNMEKAQQRFETGLEMIRKTDDRLLEGSILNHLANLHHAQGNLDQAEIIYLDALTIHRQVHHRKGEAKILSNLASLHKQKGKIDEAKRLFEHALMLNQEMGDRIYEGVILGSLANLHQLMGEIDQALTLYEQALIINRETGARQSEVINCINLGSLLMEQKNITKARTLFKESLKISQMIGAKRLEGVIFGNLGSIHHELGNVEKAYQHFQAALTIHSEVDNRIFKGWILCQIATLQRQTRGSPRKITELLTESEKLIRKSGHTMAIVYFLCECGHHAISRKYSAQQYLTKAVLEIESMKIQPESRLQRMIAKLERAQKALEAGETERLHQGELITDISPGLRQWLQDKGVISPEQPLWSKDNAKP